MDPARVQRILAAQLLNELMRKSNIQAHVGRNTNVFRASSAAKAMEFRKHR